MLVRVAGCGLFDVRVEYLRFPVRRFGLSTFRPHVWRLSLRPSYGSGLSCPCRRVRLRLRSPRRCLPVPWLRFRFGPLLFFAGFRLFRCGSIIDQILQCFLGLSTSRSRLCRLQHRRDVEYTDAGEPTVASVVFDTESAVAVAAASAMILLSFHSVGYCRRRIARPAVLKKIWTARVSSRSRKASGMDPCRSVRKCRKSFQAWTWTVKPSCNVHPFSRNPSRIRRLSCEMMRGRVWSCLPSCT